jgi:hypothetical protein
VSAAAAPEGRTVPADGREPSEAELGRVGRLRGAEVQVDGRRVATAAVVLVLVTLAVLVVAFTLAGLHKNAQIDQLHNDGVAVSVRVTACQGLLGGSGSNLVGYSCRGAFTLDGRRYTELLPGMSGYRLGSTVPSVAVPGDPALVTPVDMLATEHTGDGVFLLPAVLLGVLVLLVLVTVLRWRAGRRTPGAQTGGV